MTGALVGPLLLYLELSVLLAVAYGVFRSARWLATFARVRLDWSSTRRVARTVLVAAALAPVVSHLVVSLPAVLPTSGAPSEELVAGFRPGPELTGVDGLVATLLPPRVGAHGWLTPSRTRTAVAIAAVSLVVGVLLASVVTAVRVVQLRRLVRAAVPYRRHGRLRIVVSDRTSTPFSTALGGAAHVVLPVELLRYPDELRLVLQHELQHHRSGDPSWAIALELGRLLFFWHPAAHLWLRDLTELQELACDEALVRRGAPVRAYASCLVRVAAMAVHRRTVASAAMATAGDGGSRLERRIDMLFDHESTPATRRARTAASAVSAAAVTGAALLAAISWPRASELPHFEDEPEVVAAVRTAALAHDVTMGAAVANDGLDQAAVELSGTLDALRELLGALRVESEVEVRRMQLEESDLAAAAATVHATLVVGRARGDRVRSEAVVDRAMEMFDGDRVSKLEVVLDPNFDEATIFYRGADDACATDLPCPDAPTTLPAPGPLQLAIRRDAPDLEFEHRDGTGVSLSDLEGKVVLLDFWASWCPPCADELPQLKSLDLEFGGPDFEVLGVSLSRSAEAAAAFVELHDVPWAQLHLDDGFASPAVEAFDVRAIPSHVLVDRRGQFVHVPLGDPARLTAAVRSLLTED